MLIVMTHDATEPQVAAVMAAVRAQGCEPKPVPGGERVAICVLRNQGAVNAAVFETLPGVLECIPVTRPYKLVSRETHPGNTVVKVHGVPIGVDICMIAGPCAVESRDQVRRIAAALAARGVRLFRAGAFKPRTSPYAFQGLGRQALEWLAEIRSEFGMGIVTEATDHVNYDEVEAAVDMVQIGARNMQNYSLLQRAGKSRKPVLLKRGMSATVTEWLMAAEYILMGGNEQVVLCERGVRTFADHTRNTLDLSSIPVVKDLSHLPVLVDPSHAAGTWQYVTPLALAACAVGAHGLMVEVHDRPAEALSDGGQSLKFATFDALQRGLAALRSGSA